MAFYNFGYAINTMASANQSNASRDISPAQDNGINMLNWTTGDIANSQILKLTIMGGDFDFLWGIHLWSSRTYKVTK